MEPDALVVELTLQYSDLVAQNKDLGVFCLDRCAAVVAVARTRSSHRGRPVEAA
jgi:hypothetical protein